MKCLVSTIDDRPQDDKGWLREGDTQRRESQSLHCLIEGGDAKMVLNLLRRNVDSLAKILTKLSQIASTVLLMFLASLIVGNVILRYVFHSPLTWAEEIVGILIVWVVFFAMGIAFQKGLHIGVTLLLESLPKKLGQVIAFCSKLLLIATLGVLVRDGLRLAIHSFDNIMPASGIAQTWLYIPVPLGSFFVIIYLLNDILNGPGSNIRGGE
jgi:TRAP-type transport system small permease protein